jgi:CubicO group peptidase (beta-lactamase class C family)
VPSAATGEVRSTIFQGSKMESIQNRRWLGTSIAIAALAWSWQIATVNAAEIATPRQMFDGAMRPDVEVNTFSHYDQVFPARVVPHGNTARPLPLSARKLPAFKFTSGVKTVDLYDYLSLNRVAGLLIVKNGEIVLEDYELGTDAATRWASFSVAKSFASTLVGAAIQDGHIKSIDDPLVKYLPQMKDGPYANVSVRNVLQMASGVRWDETYTNPKSDRRKLLEEQLAQQPGRVMKFMNTLTRAGDPGAIWNYNTGETLVVGALLEAATKKPLAKYLSEKLWIPLGMEREATWQLESQGGMGFAGSGLFVTLRDYARFGLFVLNDGVIGGRRVVPEKWFADAASPKIVGGKSVDYGYMWWPTPKGDPVLAGSFCAEGIFGQFIHINPKEKLVIVVLSARPKPTGSDVISDNDFFAAVAKALK